MSARKLAVELYKDGFGPSEAARLANMATVSVYNRYGVKVNQSKPTTTSNSVSSAVCLIKAAHHYNKALTPDCIKKIKEEFFMGSNYSELGRKYGVTYNTIKNYVMGK